MNAKEPAIIGDRERIDKAKTFDATAKPDLADVDLPGLRGPGSLRHLALRQRHALRIHAWRRLSLPRGPVSVHEADSRQNNGRFVSALPRASEIDHGL